MGTSWYHPLLYGAFTLIVSLIAGHLIERGVWVKAVRMTSLAIIWYFLLHAVTAWMVTAGAHEQGISFGAPLACTIVETVMAMVAWGLHRVDAEWARL